MINPKLQLIFHQNDKIYKISRNSYIFKYKKNEFQNLLNNMEIINIIKIDYFDRINILSKITLNLFICIIIDLKEII